MRVSCLRSSGGYRALVGGAPALEELDLYLGAQDLARQRLPAPEERAVAGDLGLPEYPDGVGAGPLDRSLGLLDARDLFRRLDAPQLGEEPAVGLHPQAASPELVGVGHPEVRRHDDGRTLRPCPPNKVSRGRGEGAGAALQLLGELDEIQLVE